MFSQIVGSTVVNQRYLRKNCVKFRPLDEWLLPNDVVKVLYFYAINPNPLCLFGKIKQNQK